VARTKLINGVPIPCTPEEEAERDAEELAWANRHIPTDDEIDQEMLNRALAEPGSIVRALAEVMFQEINKLRVRGGQTAYTKQQFIDALKTAMRA